MGEMLGVLGLGVLSKGENRYMRTLNNTEWVWAGCIFTLGKTGFLKGSILVPCLKPSKVRKKDLEHPPSPYEA